MGNAHSSSANCADARQPRERTLSHHRSAHFSHKQLVPRKYASSASISSHPSQDTYFNPPSEKAALSAAHDLADRIHSHPPQPSAPYPVPPPSYLPTPTAGLFLPSPADPPHPPSTAGKADDIPDPAAYAAFLRAYPEYHLTWSLDALRRTEFSRVDAPHSRETYVDYMGGALYPASLVSVHADFLKSAVMGNTHSASPRYESAVSVSRSL